MLRKREEKGRDREMLRGREERVSCRKREKRNRTKLLRERRERDKFAERERERERFAERERDLHMSKDEEISRDRQAATDRRTDRDEQRGRGIFFYNVPPNQHEGYPQLISRQC